MSEGRATSAAPPPRPLLPPYNFSWVIRNALCASARPRTLDNVLFLRDEGVEYLVTLSSDQMPHSEAERVMTHCLIPVVEFEAPSLQDINKFLELCAKARAHEKIVCVHCRMGRGRTGVMLACYLVKFCDQPPQTAISNIRLMRPYSVETYEQERAVKDYWDYLGRTMD